MKRCYSSPRMTDHGTLAHLTHKSGIKFYDAFSGAASGSTGDTMPMPLCYDRAASNGIPVHCLNT